MVAWAVKKKQEGVGGAGRATLKVNGHCRRPRCGPRQWGPAAWCLGARGVVLGALLTWARATATSLWADQFLCFLEQSSSINLKQIENRLSCPFPELLLGQGPHHPGGEEQ